MKNLGIHEPLWQELNTRVWHATTLEGLEGIIRDGEIILGVGNRYRGSFCLSKNYVSLFDFVTEEETMPNPSWVSWLGEQRGDKRVSIWLEVDHESAGDKFINATELCREWTEELDSRTTGTGIEEPFQSLLFSGVEAGYQGQMPTSLLRGALLIDGNNHNCFISHQGFGDELLPLMEEFGKSLAPDPDLPRLRKYR